MSRLAGLLWRPWPIVAVLAIALAWLVFDAASDRESPDPFRGGVANPPTTDLQPEKPLDPSMILDEPDAEHGLPPASPTDGRLRSRPHRHSPNNAGAGADLGVINGMFTGGN
jgi:hypothetical protein